MALMTFSLFIFQFYLLRTQNKIRSSNCSLFIFNLMYILHARTQTCMYARTLKPQHTSFSLSPVFGNQPSNNLGVEQATTYGQYLHIQRNRPLAHRGNAANLKDKTKEIFSSGN